MSNNGNGKNDYSRLMANLDKRMSTGMNNLNESVVQGTKATIKQTRESESRLMKGIKTGLTNVNETVNQGTKAVITQTRQSEANLSKKIDNMKGVALKGIDWLTIILTSVLFGLVGCLFCQYMIRNKMAAWVKVTETVINDANGNFIGFGPSTTTILWPVTILTVAILMFISALTAYIVVDGIRQKEGD